MDCNYLYHNNIYDKIHTLFGTSSVQARYWFGICPLKNRPKSAQNQIDILLFFYLI